MTDTETERDTETHDYRGVGGVHSLAPPTERVQALQQQPAHRAQRTWLLVLNYSSLGPSWEWLIPGWGQGKTKMSLEPLFEPESEDILREKQAHVQRTNRGQSEQ